jgi:hypothetical protein
LPHRNNQCANGVGVVAADRPARWGEFFDLRVMSIVPPGRAAAGQIVKGETGPRPLRLKVEARYEVVDPANHRLKLRLWLPFGVVVDEDLSCAAVSDASRRVSYHCDFGFDPGWRGRIMRFLMRGELENGPLDSLNRLKRGAERAVASA